MRTAVVHDWLNGMRGGEKVLEAMLPLLPDPTIFTLFHVPGSVSDTIERHRIVTSSLQKLPLARKHYRRYLPLYPTAIEQFNLGPGGPTLRENFAGINIDRSTRPSRRTPDPLSRTSTSKTIF